MGAGAVQVPAFSLLAPVCNRFISVCATSNGAPAQLPQACGAGRQPTLRRENFAVNLILCTFASAKQYGVKLWALYSGKLQTEISKRYGR